MVILQNIHSLLSRESVQGAKDTTLRHEQIVYGRVSKIYPNHTAVVQIGNHTFIAKIETSLTANAQYWFQVFYENETLTLKVLEQLERPLLDSKNKEELAAEQLMKKWGLSDHAGRLLRFLLKQNLPIIKKHLLQAAQWLEKAEHTDVALQAIKLIYENNLPFTKETFAAMKALGSSQPLYKQLIVVRDALLSLPERTETIQKLLKQLNRLFEGQEKITAKQWGLFHTEEEINETQLAERYPSLLSNKHLSKSEAQLLETVVANGMNDGSVSAVDRLAKQLKQIIQSLGLQYEADLQSAAKAKTMKDVSFDELKPLLLKVMQELSSNSGVKEAVESIIRRLTAQQLLSQEHGPLQHIFLQIPWKFGEQLTDVTVQWHGKKQKNGQIDPNYCRILFYLQLPFLKETLIDVHIQNRVVNISIMTETTGLQPIITAMQPMLKENLERLRYKLSAVKAVQLEKQNQRDDSALRFSAAQFIQGIYSGVDYRI
jgi:hypothetical protein